MKPLYQELKSILDCKIELVKKKQVKPNKNQTLIRTESESDLLIHRALTELEMTFVQKWIEKDLSLALDAEVNLLLDPNGYKENLKTQKYPLNLWRIQYKENHEDVYEILNSSFGTDRIVAISKQESVVFVTRNSISPYELLGMLESEALTRAKIIIGNTVTQPSELHGAYLQLIELTELAQLVKQKAQVITYEALLFPMLVRQLKRANLGQDVEHDMFMQGIMKHHVRPVGDAELEQTAIYFFDNNLNITETANELFIHRNTLIYRLNKLESITGYDIRKFNDAINYYLSYLGDKIN